MIGAMRSVPSALCALRRESTLLSVLASLALALKLIVAAVGLPTAASASEIICSSAGSAPTERSNPPLHGGDSCICGSACTHLAKAGAGLAPATAAPGLPSLTGVATAYRDSGAPHSSSGPSGSLGSRAPPYA